MKPGANLTTILQGSCFSPKPAFSQHWFKIRKLKWFRWLKSHDDISAVDLINTILCRLPILAPSGIFFFVESGKSSRNLQQMWPDKLHLKHSIRLWKWAEVAVSSFERRFRVKTSLPVSRFKPVTFQLALPFVPVIGASYMYGLLLIQSMFGPQYKVASTLGGPWCGYQQANLVLPRRFPEGLCILKELAHAALLITVDFCR